MDFLKSQRIIYSIIVSLSLLTLNPLSSLGADSLWDYNAMDTTGSEMSENYVYSDSVVPENTVAKNTKDSKIKEKKKRFNIFNRNKKNKQETQEPEIQLEKEELPTQTEDSTNKSMPDTQEDTPKFKPLTRPQENNYTNYYNNSTNETPAVSRSSTKGSKYIKDIEIHGTNVISPEIILTNIKQKKGEIYDRNTVQEDLRNIYQLGYFSEKMRAIPVNNPDGTITLKIILEENAPVTDFTIEGNTVVSTEEILSYLIDMKGKPQNIAQLNEAIAKIQQCYASKGYILARIDSVTDDPDGTINISLKEGTINRILIAGNEKTKDFVIERNVLSEPGMIYNENLLKEDIVRLYASQAFKDVTREITPCPDIPDAYDITINVQEQRTANISIGGGLDTVTGVFGSLGIKSASN